MMISHPANRAHYARIAVTGTIARPRLPDVHTWQIVLQKSALVFWRLSENGAAIDLDQIRPRAAGHTIFMRKEGVIDLARYCTDMMQKGEDFPTVWQGRLKRHPLIDGIPRQTREGNQNLLEIRLITGERLVSDADAKRFSVR